MNWIIIAILIVLAFVFVRMRHIKHKVFLILFLLILLFLYITATRIFADQHINWKSVAGIEKGTRIYFVWLRGAFDNVKIITGNVIKMDWAMKNKTESAIKVIEEKEEK